MVPTIYTMCGYPCSGKSTYAKNHASQYNAIVVSADEIRRTLYGSPDEYGDSGKIWDYIVATIRSLLKQGKNIIYDACNLRKSYRYDLMEVIEDIPCNKVLIYMDTPIEDCKARHPARGRQFTLKDLEPIYAIDEPPSLDEGWDKIQRYKWQENNAVASGVLHYGI